METKPVAQPTAILEAESQVKHVQRVLGGRAAKEASSHFTIKYPDSVGL